MSAGGGGGGSYVPSSPTGAASPLSAWATPSSSLGGQQLAGAASPAAAVAWAAGPAPGAGAPAPMQHPTLLGHVATSAHMSGVAGMGFMKTSSSASKLPSFSKVVSDGGSSVTSGGISSLGSGSLKSKAPDDLDTDVVAMCERIDTDGNLFISKLELIAAVQNDPIVAAYVLPDRGSGSRLSSCEETFDLVDALFDKMAGGKQRIKYAEFAAHFRKAALEKTANAYEMRTIFDLIDADGNSSVSKFELVAAVQSKKEVADYVLPGASSNVMDCEETFNTVNSIFEVIAGGKRRIEFADFEAHFRKVMPVQPQQHLTRDRSGTRVFVIGPGFGQQLNPRQGAMITNAGYQVHFCHGIPNPETPNFPVFQYLQYIKAELDAFQPDVVCCASKGGVYVVGLWQVGYWRGPTVFINAHPTCKQLPEGVPVVLAQGANDEVYSTPREELERILATGTPNRCFLYYAANSGTMGTGQRTRMGDFHNMESLLSHDLLPRLIDATLCAEGPELHMVRSWRERLTEVRLDSERWLGYSPEQLRKRWVTRGMDNKKLHEVLPGSEEFQHVAAVFMSSPHELPAYRVGPQAIWDRGVRILAIQRVENGLQFNGSTKPYYESLRRNLEVQGIDFEPGTHTSWAFHGAQPAAIESIVGDTLTGFQPLAAGSRSANVWGSGTYFARDAKYVVDGGFTNAAPDGSRQMLMCLLMTGMPCIGDPGHKGVLPFRNKPHRYNSSVDSLSSPEIIIVQNPGSALPAYLITFV